MNTQTYFILFLLFLQGCAEKGDIATSTLPNFVLIMADDLGYEGLSCYGNQVLKTPHLDELAQYGLRFTDFHSNGSVCTPTRAALLTGKYQQRVGMEGVIYVKPPSRSLGMDTSVVTMAELLKTKGYQTGVFGKWHLGYEMEYHPNLQGFDEFYGYLSGNVDYHTHYDNAGIYDWWHNQDTIKEKGYVTDLITERALDFMEQHQSKPFFLYLPHEAPHVPFQGRNDPSYRFSDNKFTYHGPVEDRDRAYNEMVEVMDENIGLVVQKIRDLGLEENTLIVFISDNGAEPFGHNGNLRGAKVSLFEGGHRVPAIAYWKDKIASGVSDELVMSFDWLPTFLAQAGIQPSKNVVLDGIDLSDHLLKQDTLPSRNLYWRYRNQKVVRQDHYKLMLTQSDTLLFDLEQDLEEQNNLINNFPNLALTLQKKLAAWEAQMDQYPQKTR